MCIVYREFWQEGLIFLHNNLSVSEE